MLPPVVRPARRRGVRGTALPVLVDHHVHLGLVDAERLADGGIGAVVDLGWDPSIVRLAERCGVAVAYAGQFLTAPGGYPSDRSWAPERSVRPVASPADAERAVREQRALGVSLLKVTLHPDAGPVLDRATLRALVEAAGDLPVVAHAEGPGTVETALVCGVAALAHTPWTEQLPEDLVRGCAAAGQRWISTLAIHADQTEAQECALANLTLFHGAGGVVLYGTDLGNGPLPVGLNPREVALLGRAGLDREVVLAALTDPWPGVAREGVRTFVPDSADVDDMARWLQAARVVDAAELEED